MGDDSLILREDGYIRMNFPVTSLTYHSNLNIILVKTDVGGVHVLDVNSGVILQSSCLSAGKSRFLMLIMCVRRITFFNRRCLYIIGDFKIKLISSHSFMRLELPYIVSLDSSL